MDEPRTTSEDETQMKSFDEHRMMPRELRYRPLSSLERQIRLLILYPGSVQDPVRCFFALTHLSKPDAYEAISYVWGSTTRTHLVFSPSGESALPVTASAYSALKAVRSPTVTRIVWIDGLCINQNDEAEKAQQVSYMGDIYGKARRTLVYLGEDNGQFRFVVQGLLVARLPRYNPSWVPLYKKHPIIRAMKKVNFNSRALLTDIVSVAYWAREMEYGCQDAFKPLLDFRKSFFAHPWFKRLWIIQEIALSTHVSFHFAEQTLPWATIMAFYVLHDFWFHQSNRAFYGHPVVSDRSILGTRIMERMMDEACDDPGDAEYDFFAFEALVLRHRTAAFNQTQEYYNQGLQKLTLKDHLLSIMYEMRHYECGDARDKLYAVLSLFHDETPASLRPDYRASATSSNLFTNISRYLIEMGNLGVLSAAQGMSG